MESGFVAHLARSTASQAACARVRVHELRLTTLASRQTCYTNTRPLDNRLCSINPGFVTHLACFASNQVVCARVHELRPTTLVSRQTDKPTTNNHPLDT